MQRVLFPVIIILFTICTLVSCDNAGTGDGTSETATDSLGISSTGEVIHGSLTATANGQAWTADKVSTEEKDGSLIITGTAADGSKIVLEVGEKPALGIFPIKRGRMQAATYTTAGAPATTYRCPFQNTTGVITIESIDDIQVSGEFSFTGSNFDALKMIENGKFAAGLPKKSTL